MKLIILSPGLVKKYYDRNQSQLIYIMAEIIMSEGRVFLMIDEVDLFCNICEKLRQEIRRLCKSSNIDPKKLPFLVGMLRPAKNCKKISSADLGEIKNLVKIQSNQIYLISDRREDYSLVRSSSINFIFSSGDRVVYGHPKFSVSRDLYGLRSILNLGSNQK